MILIISNPLEEIRHSAFGPVQHEIVMYISPKEAARIMGLAVCRHFILTYCNMVSPWGKEVGIFLFFKRMKNYYHSIPYRYRLQRLWHEIFRKFILEFNILKACFKTITVISGSVTWTSLWFKKPFVLVDTICCFHKMWFVPTQEHHIRLVMHCFRMPLKEEL